MRTREDNPNSFPIESRVWAPCSEAESGAGEGAQPHFQEEAAQRHGAHRHTQRGSALVAILWLTAALAAITFALAVNVRGEIDRASTAADGLRSYYLATGSITRALLWMEWGTRRGPLDDRPLFVMMPRLTFQYPSGIAVVEIIPESSKLNVNSATAQQLFRLLLVLGAPDPQARVLTDAILDWRKAPEQGGGLFDGVYRASSFLAPHASFQQVEELLLVRGMTPELFYGYYGPGPDGSRIWHSGLRDCVTTLGAQGTSFDVNTVAPPLLASFGAAPASIQQLLLWRNRTPIHAVTDVANLFPEEVMTHLTVGGGVALTLRATARVRLPNGGFSDLKRTVSALVRLPSGEKGAPLPDPRHPYTIVRWYDNEVSDMLPLLPPPAAAPGAGQP
jgi:general secretion pathway protein K